MPQTLTPDNITAHLEQTYAGVEDITVPGREELGLLFSRFGVMTYHPTRLNVFSIVIEGDALTFRRREVAWDFYLRNRDRLETIALERVCPF